MCSSLRGRFNTLITDFAAPLQTLQHDTRRRNLNTDITAHRRLRTPSQTSQHHYRHRALNVETALAMISHHDRLVSIMLETSLRF